MNVSEELARLAQLRDQGVLTQDEFETQKAAVLRGDHPATPAAKAEGKGKSKLGIGCLVVLGIIILLAMIGTLADDKAGNQQQSGAGETPPAASPPRAVTARELFEAYQANEAAAQKQFGDQPLLVTGRISSIDLDVTDKPTLLLETPNEFMSAHADLTEASQAKASDLSKGETVKLLCSDVGEVMSTPMLKDCEIQ